MINIEQFCYSQYIITQILLTSFTSEIKLYVVDTRIGFHSNSTVNPILLFHTRYITYKAQFAQIKNVLCSYQLGKNIQSEFVV